jgi:uncharacterized protein (DUF983 family)
MQKPSAFDLRRYASMHEKCPHCGFKFEVEPGFFYGAMYFSYAFSIVTIVVFFTFTYLVFGNPALWVYLLTICTALVLSMPLSFRYSRTLMLHLFGGVSYDKKM